MAFKEYWNKNWEDPWQNLLYYMEIREKSFKQLAEESGVSQGTIEGWRRDSTAMLRARTESIVRVCDALNARPSYMLGLKADPKRSREAANDLIDFCRIPRTRREIAEHLGLSSLSYAIQTHVIPLVEAGLIKLSIPDKPRSHKQTYFSE